VRTQQMIAYESGIARSVDPLGGSYFVEQHTDRMEQAIESVMREIEEYGGVVKAIEDGWLQMRLAERALERKTRIDSGETVIVGQNHFRREDQRNEVGETFHLDPKAAGRVLEKYQRVRDTRDAAAVEKTLAKLATAAADDGENLMPYLVDCCHAYATVGEMVAVMKKQWGEFQEPVRL
jgi:methylmalonyl-CoA mutase, N-terminal domain